MASKRAFWLCQSHGLNVASRSSTRLSTARCSFNQSASASLRPLSRATTRPGPQHTRTFTCTASKCSDTPRTALYDLHASHGAKFVPFGGYLMPVSYTDLSISDSHKWTREKASLFDVGHMVQNRLTGPKAAEFLETITPSDVAKLNVFTSTLSCFLMSTGREGGILDDTVIVRLGPEEFYFVSNAGCREKDAAYLAQELQKFRSNHGLVEAQCNWEILQDQGLVALQGPQSAGILERVLAEPAAVNLKETFFGTCKYGKVRLLDGSTSSDLLISRGGYTGEDGFEISIPGAETAAVTETLLKTAGQDSLRLAGLGARDSLRLEAGMCLYGHDLNEDITPPEAALGWVVGQEARQRKTFYGADTITKQLLGLKKGGPEANGGIAVERRRVGLVIEGAPAREGATIHDANGDEIGTITSGCPSPTLGKNIAMGYIQNGLHKAGTTVQVKVRNKLRNATVSKMPFVPSKYFKTAIAPA